VAIPSYANQDRLVETIERIKKCRPAPREFLVYIDAADDGTRSAMRAHHPDITTLFSRDQLGPGGGRNRLVDVAKEEFVASFDDDSYPLDEDYFGRLVETFRRFPRAGAVAAQITHRGEEPAEPQDRYWRVAEFVGCGAAYRREAFLETTGYVELPVAYGMEEVDLSIRLAAHDWQIISCGSLRVLHDTDRSNQRDRWVVAATLANLALLAYLRYPAGMMWLGPAQLASKWFWYLRHQYFKGLFLGLLQIPGRLWRHRHDRFPVRPEVLREYRRLRRNPKLLSL
jgi:GT2 family glycosyltransferase